MANAQQHLLETTAEQLASEFLSRFRASGIYLRDHIARLAELATSEDRAAARSATAALFTSLVERLADSFEPASVSLYNRMLAQVIQHCRTSRFGRELDSELTGFGLASENDLVTRAERLRRVLPFDHSRELRQNIKLAVVLSRVTIGADVAITSVIVERLKQEFPFAEIAFVGGRKAAELFGGDSRLSFHEAAYGRAGTTGERLLNWLEVLRCVRALTRDFTRGERLIVDPDSRLSQLGLLPLTEARFERDAEPKQAAIDYLFFPSREYGSHTSQSLAELTSAWLNEVFGGGQITFPRLSLAAADRDAAKALIQKLRRPGARAVISINLGVGENPLKRIGGDFERELVCRLIEDGAAVILDKGAGEEEARRTDAIIAAAKRIQRHGRGLQVIEADEASLNDLLKSDASKAEMIVWSGRIGLLAAMIAESDLYIGYDSAGQHIAAALGVPCIDVFAGFSSPRMLDRWRPAGIAQKRVVAVDESSNANDILSEALRHARAMLSSEQ